MKELIDQVWNAPAETITTPLTIAGIIYLVVLLLAVCFIVYAFWKLKR